MPYNEGIDVRIQAVVSDWKNTTSKKMFGGVCYLMNGNMVAGVYKDFLILRLGEDETETAMALSHVRPFDITGRPMKGWVMVEEEGFKNDEELSDWLDKAKAFVEKLRPK